MTLEGPCAICPKIEAGSVVLPLLLLYLENGIVAQVSGS